MFELCPSIVAKSGCRPSRAFRADSSLSMDLGQCWEESKCLVCGTPSKLNSSKVIFNTYSPPKKKWKQKIFRAVTLLYNTVMMDPMITQASWCVCPNPQPEHRREWWLTWRMDSGWSGRGGAGSRGACAPVGAEPGWDLGITWLSVLLWTYNCSTR